MKKGIGFGVVFQASAAEVFALVASAEGMSQWMTGTELRRRKRGEFLTGDYRVYESPLGRIKEEIIQCDRNRYLTYRIVEGRFLEGIEGLITISPKGNQTRLDWEISVPQQGTAKTQLIAQSYRAYLFTGLQYHALRQRGRGLMSSARAA